MSLIETVMKLCGIDALSPADCRVVVFDNRAAHFCGVKQIVSFSSSEIQIRTKNYGYTVSGNKLCVERFCEGDLVITGEIMGVNRK